MASKIAEADVLFKEGDKCVTTGLFRWKPDYENGSLKFESAANMYRDAKAKDKAVVAFKRAGECFEKLELPFKAGQKYEAAGLLSKELKMSTEAMDYYQRAAFCFQQHGASDKASDTFLKSAKVAEEANLPDKALEIVNQSIDLLEADSKFLFVPANYRAGTALLVKRGQLEQAIALYKRQLAVHEKTDQQMDVWKCILSIIILSLLRDDFVAAEKIFSEHAGESPGFVASDFGQAANHLLEAIEKKNKELFDKLQQQQVFTFLDIEVARAFKKLSLSGSNAESKDSLA